MFLREQREREQQAMLSTTTSMPASKEMGASVMTTTKEIGSMDARAKELTDDELEQITGGADAKAGAASGTTRKEPYHPLIPIIAILIG
jgi:bacteriocin-like protein